MPYIRCARRWKFQTEIDELKEVLKQESNSTNIDGDLNFIITSLFEVAPEVCGEREGHWRYRIINRLVGVLECCKLEFYRRIGALKEDDAINRNGDLQVYEDPH